MPCIGVPTVLAIFIILSGFAIIEPNTASIVTFCGKYEGTVKVNGFWWLNPLVSKRAISLKVYNLGT